MPPQAGADSVRSRPRTLSADNPHVFETEYGNKNSRLRLLNRGTPLALPST
jgi:hypothetical protein